MVKWRKRGMLLTVEPTAALLSPCIMVRACLHELTPLGSPGSSAYHCFSQLVSPNVIFDLLFHVNNGGLPFYSDQTKGPSGINRIPGFAWDICWYQ